MLIVSISGSWCPNCHDEAPFLADLYRRYQAKGLEIVADGMRPRHLNALQNEQGFESLLHGLLRIEAGVFEEYVRSDLALRRPGEIAPRPTQLLARILRASALRRHTLPVLHAWPARRWCPRRP